MHPDNYRALILRAAELGDAKTLDMLAKALTDAERAKEILRAKGYGCPGMSTSFTASLVPDARVIPL